MADLAKKAETIPGAKVETVAPVYVSGMPIGALVKALENNRYYLFSQMSKNENQFWSGVPEAPSSKNFDILDIWFDTPHLINTLSFDVSRFPHDMRLFYLDEDEDSQEKWKPLKNSAGIEITASIKDSIPATIVPTPPGVVSHPMHRGAGHWVTRTYQTKPTVVSRLRLQFRKVNNGRGPKDAKGKILAYSTAVRNLKVGYAIAMRSDVPKTNRALESVSEREAFTSTMDMLGSPVSLSMRENRASDLLRGGVWKSEPQPVPNAVVNMFVDARDAQGQGQLIDKFHVTTQTSGVSCNLYYSNSPLADPRKGLEAGDRPLGFPLSQGHGLFTAGKKGIEFSTDLGFISVDNAAVQFDANKPFTLGFSCVPRFDSVDGDYPVFDSGSLLVTVGSNGIVANLGGTEVQLDAPFAKNSNLSFVVYRTNRSELKIRCNKSSGDASVVLAPKATKGANRIQIGGSERAGLSSRSLLNAVFIRVGEPTGSEDDYETFFTSPQKYVVGIETSDTTSTSDNMVLRHLPIFMSSSTQSGGSRGRQDTSLSNEFGMVGGRPNIFDDLVWTPVAQDYRLHTGFMAFSPVKAKFFKMEFTNLAPMPFEDYFAQSRTVKLFPQAVVAPSSVGKNQTQSNDQSIRPVQPTGNPMDSAGAASSVASAVRYFADQSQHYTTNTPLNPPPSYIPTTAVVSSDPTLASQIRSSTLVYNNLQQWHPTSVVPQFTQTQQHVYEKVEIAHTQKIAFFAGLTSLKMFRVNYESADDTGVYVEPFIDEQGLKDDFALADGMKISDDGWTINTKTGGISSPMSQASILQESTLTSKIFSSTRRVTGIQFATQQSDPIQILDDPDMSDTTISNWVPIGDASVSMASSVASPTSGMVKVSRNSGSAYWRTLQATYPTWADILEPGYTWGEIAAGSATASPLGGVRSKKTYPVSRKGHVYAAARVYSSKPITSPLLLQIVNDSGQVVAEEPMMPGEGQTAEWWTSIDLSAYANVSSARWIDVQAKGTWADVMRTAGEEDATSQATWKTIMDNSDLSTGSLGVQLAQVTPSVDEWHVDSIALFEDPIVWEFSRNGGKTFYKATHVRNNPDALLTFPPFENVADGMSLIWRVTSTRPNQRIQSLIIRPRYESLPLGKLADDTMLTGGPHVSKADLHFDIHNDPRWTKGFTPIPQDWWASFRRWLEAQGVSLPPTDQEVQEGTAPAPTEPLALRSSALLATTMEPDYQALSGRRIPLPQGREHDEFRPAGQPAVAILSSGYYAVATVMVENTSRYGGVASKPSFVRVWKVAPDMTIFSEFDWHPADAINAVGQVPNLNIHALDDDKISIVLDDSFDSAQTHVFGGMSGETFGRIYFIDPHGHRVPDETLGVDGRFDWFGAAPYLSGSAPGTSGGILSPLDVDSRVCAQISGFTPPERTEVVEARVSVYFRPPNGHLVPSKVLWSFFTDSSNPYVTTIAGNGSEGIIEPKHLGESGWFKMTLKITGSKVKDLAGALEMGAVVFSIDPGGEDGSERKVGQIEVSIDTEIKAGETA